MDVVWPILRVLALVYLGVMVLMYFVQPRFLYFPGKDVDRTPADVGLAFEEVHLEVDASVVLHGWWVPHENAVATILHLHGNAGTIAGRVGVLAALHELGVNVLMIDYRGYGKSTGTPSEAGLYADADAALTHLLTERGVPADRVVVQGRSLGGAVACWVAVERHVAGLILESAFTSVPDMAARLYPYLPGRYLCRDRFDTRTRIANLSCPVLVTHGQTDEVVPYAMGRANYAAAPQPKAFYEMRGGHNDFVMDAAYLSALRRFVAESVGAEASGRSDG